MRRLAAALCLLLAGCLTDTTAPASALPGTWASTSVNAQPLPFTYPNGTTLLDKQVVITTNRAYSSTEHYADGRTHFEEGGYTLYGRIAVFTDVTDGIQYEAQ